MEEILEILPAKCQKDDGKDLSVSSDISFNGEIADTISETNDNLSLQSDTDSLETDMDSDREVDSIDLGTFFKF